MEKQTERIQEASKSGFKSGYANGKLIGREQAIAECIKEIEQLKMKFDQMIIDDRDANDIVVNTDEWIGLIKAKLQAQMEKQ